MAVDLRPSSQSTMGVEPQSLSAMFRQRAQTAKQLLEQQLMERQQLSSQPKALGDYTSFDQYMAETGQQPQLDHLRRTFQYDDARQAFQNKAQMQVNPDVTRGYTATDPNVARQIGRQGEAGNLGKYKITQGYGNYNPGLYAGITADSRHKGVDVGTPEGTVVQAPVDGMIEQGYDKNWGNYVLIHGDDGVTYRFSHLSQLPNFSGRIRAGSVLGATGNTGYSTGAHLDISATRGGQFIDPLSLAVIQSMFKE